MIKRCYHWMVYRYHWMAYRYYLGRCQHCRVKNPWERREQCSIWLLKALIHQRLSMEPGMKYLVEAILEAWKHQPGDRDLP